MFKTFLTFKYFNPSEIYLPWWLISFKLVERWTLPSYNLRGCGIYLFFFHLISLLFGLLQSQNCSPGSVIPLILFRPASKPIFNYLRFVHGYIATVAQQIMYLLYDSWSVALCSDTSPLGSVWTRWRAWRRVRQGERERGHKIFSISGSICFLSFFPRRWNVIGQVRTHCISFPRSGWKSLNPTDLIVNCARYQTKNCSSGNN